MVTLASLSLAAGLSLGASDSLPVAETDSGLLAHWVVPTENFKVAFLGDQGLGSYSEAVLRVIRDEGVHLLVHLGDFDYLNDPAAWERQTDRILGADFPYLAVMGNHDVLSWPGDNGYAALVRRRVQRMGAACEGEIGLQYTCLYHGIRFVLTTPGLTPGDHAAYIRQQLSTDSTLWRISAWHVNQALMQVGGKGDEAGWGVYEESRRAGAVIATAHEHSYSRTHLLQNMTRPSVISRDSVLKLRKGRSFVFVAGLGGGEVRPQFRSGDWWAKIYTATQSALHGALIATFYVDGNPRKALFRFKNIEGQVIDRFEAISEIDIPIPQGPGIKPMREQQLVLDPAAWGLAAGGSLRVQDLQGRTLVRIHPWNGTQRITLKSRGLVLLRIENPKGQIHRKLVLLP